MKGLILKDLYMMKHYCKSYLIIAIVFLIVSLSDTVANMFFLFYPCMLCGIIPINLLGYDERSKFIQYSATLPYTKKQIVSSKYLLGLLAQIAVLIITGIAHGIKMSITNTFVFNDFIIILLSILIISALISSFSLPFIFKYGIEKGRIAYYVMIGVIGGASALFSMAFSDGLFFSVSSDLIFIILAVVGIGLYALSWYLSVIFYKKREL